MDGNNEEAFVKRVPAAVLAALLLAALALPTTAVAASGDVVLYGVLSGAAEVPAVQTDGAGSVYVIVNSARTKLTYVVTYRGLSGAVAAAHIHLGAAGVAGPIIIPLKPGRSPMIGTLYAANLSPAGDVHTFADAIASMRAGRTYVNLHTAAHPGGEVRAQLRLRAGDRVYGGALSGAAEAPAVTTDGTGSAFVIVNSAGNKLSYVVTYRGLSGPVAASHIHLGAAGVAGPIIIPLMPGPSPMIGTLYAANLTPAGGVTNFAQALAAIRGGMTYVNLHTAAHPGGEVRAQLR
jgi:hypothetical protein